MKNLNLRIFLNALPIQIILFITLSVIFWSGGSKAQTNIEEPKETISGKEELSPNPQMTDEQLADIKRAREEFISSPSATCAPASAIGFSVLGHSHVSEGSDAVLDFNKQLLDKVITNEGNVWKNSLSMFVVPCDGLYSMTVSFVRDPYYYGGTNDDVFMYIVVNTATRVAIPGSAWCGGSPSVVTRKSGTYSVLYRLKAGDIVQAWTRSALVNPTTTQVRRHLLEFSFSGHLVAP